VSEHLRGEFIRGPQESSSDLQRTHSLSTLNLRRLLAPITMLGRVLSRGSDFMLRRPVLTTFCLTATRGLIGDTVAQTAEAAEERSAHAEAVRAAVERGPITEREAAVAARGSGSGGGGARGSASGELGPAPVFAFDVKRAATFMGWTVCVGFAVDRWLYSTMFPRWFPSRDAAGKIIRANVAKAVVFDNFFFTPFMYFPVYYLFKVAMQERKLACTMHSGLYLFKVAVQERKLLPLLCG